jgi:4-hydroxybenzoate polyprenyltransferase
MSVADASGSSYKDRMKTWFAYAQLLRLPNVFTALADILLAFAASYVALKPDESLLDFLGPLLLLMLSSACLYSAGMVWNDWFDLEQDLRERPFRPIASGRIARGTAFRLGTVLIAAGVGFAVLADLVQKENAWWSLRFAVLLVVAIFLYDGVVKRTWLAPYAMGACRFLNVLLGLTVLGRSIPSWGYVLALAIGVYIVGVTWFARTEARMSKQSTLLAAALTMLGGLFLGLAVPALAIEQSIDVNPAKAFPFLLAIFGIYVAMKVVPAVRDPKPSRVQPAVKRAVLGLVLFDAILATSMVGLVGLVLVALLVPAQLLGKWIYST